MATMQTVDATELKTNLGDVLSRAAVERLAIRRHGRVIAYLVPAHEIELPTRKRAPKPAPMPKSLSRAEEERLLQLVASGDLRPSRWRRAGDQQLLAGLAVLLGSVDMGDRERLMALAEQLSPGMTTLERANAWLEQSPVKPDRFLPMLRARLAPQRGRRG
jgi:antitoxin (DNA-binding transcriptional repressor) of toxin-antitoxin stability system